MESALDIDLMSSVLPSDVCVLMGGRGWPVGAKSGCWPWPEGGPYPGGGGPYPGGGGPQPGGGGPPGWTLPDCCCCCSFFVLRRSSLLLVFSSFMRLWSLLTHLCAAVDGEAHQERSFAAGTVTVALLLALASAVASASWRWSMANSATVLTNNMQQSAMRSLHL